MTVLKRVHQLETSHQPTALTGEIFFPVYLKGQTHERDGLKRSIDFIGTICRCDQTALTIDEQLIALKMCFCFSFVLSPTD
jgi:hypothetical protein